MSKDTGKYTDIGSEVSLYLKARDAGVGVGAEGVMLCCPAQHIEPKLALTKEQLKEIIRQAYVIGRSPIEQHFVDIELRVERVFGDVMHSIVSGTLKPFDYGKSERICPDLEKAAQAVAEELGLVEQLKGGCNAK